MISNYNNLIVFSALISNFEKLDFKNDALAGVRANYFNSNHSSQNEKTNIEIDGKEYKLSYFLSENEPLSWKIVNNNIPYQTVKKETGGLYSVISYKQNGIINKRQFFDSKHIWIRTEYYDDKFENVLSAVTEPMFIFEYFSIKYDRFYPDGKKLTSYLFPSVNKQSNARCVGLMYTNFGMLWLDEKFRPNDSVLDDLPGIKKSGFNFSTKNFSTSLNIVNAQDLDNAEYLKPVENTDNTGDILYTASSDNNYSAYDKIERILVEAHKTNKNLFGVENNENQDNFDDSRLSEIPDNDNSKTKDNEDTADDNNLKLIQASKAEPDTSIVTETGEYLYYGELDADKLRTGRGRTETPEGFTSYEGNYVDDKRQGFGICYYKNGSVNYVGEWNNGARTGCGVGYRQSDGIMHIGKWKSNLPEEYGARFDKKGNFLDVCQYIDGIRNGKSISLNENGDIVIGFWTDGELISEKIIDGGNND